MPEPIRKGRNKPFADADRELLAGLLEAHPLAGRAKICRLFEARAGRSIHPATLTRLRTTLAREAGVVEPRPLPPKKAGRGIGLTDGQRELLGSIIAAHPRATCGQIGAIFRRRAGRAVSDSTIHDYRSGRVGRAGRNPHLTDAERELLASLARDAAPEYCRAQIAREFSALAGRTISPENVSHFLRTSLGLPALVTGKNSRSGIYRQSDRAIEAASHLKLADAKVDYSVRPGRTSRLREGA